MVLDAGKGCESGRRKLSAIGRRDVKRSVGQGSNDGMTVLDYVVFMSSARTRASTSCLLTFERNKGQRMKSLDGKRFLA